MRSLNDQAPLFSAQARHPTLVCAPAWREFISGPPDGLDLVPDKVSQLALSRSWIGFR